jgi:hypothetical protein
MASDDALDLSEIDPPVWRIMASDVVYGPYTLGQMRGFHGEGRLAAESKVAEGDGGAFLAAREHPALAGLFGAEPQRAVEAGPAEANYLITTRVKSESRAEIIRVLNDTGRFAELMSGTFVLHAAIGLSDLRKQMETVTAPDDKLVIVNASDGRLAWQGLGPETNTHVRSVWKAKG